MYTLKCTLKIIQPQGVTISEDNNLVNESTKIIPDSYEFLDRLKEGGD